MQSSSHSPHSRDIPWRTCREKHSSLHCRWLASTTAGKGHLLCYCCLAAATQLAEVLLAAPLSVQQQPGSCPPCCPVVITAAVRQGSSLLPCSVQQQQPIRGPPCCPVVCLVVATAARSLHRHLARIRRKSKHGPWHVHGPRPHVTGPGALPNPSCRTLAGWSTLPTPTVSRKAQCPCMYNRDCTLRRDQSTAASCDCYDLCIIINYMYSVYRHRYMTFVFHCSLRVRTSYFFRLRCCPVQHSCAIPVPRTNNCNVCQVCQHKPRDINLNWTSPLPCKRPCRHARYPLQQEQCRHNAIHLSVGAGTV